MTIASYSDLQTAIANYAHRTGDTTFTTNVPDFITQAESRMERDQLLRQMETEDALSTTQGNNYVALPSGFISPIAAWILLSTVRYPIELRLPEQLPYYAAQAYPRLCAVDNTNLRFERPADQVYTVYLRYFKSFNLSNSVTTNALLTSDPDIYVAACMCEAALWTQDQNALQVWEQKYAQRAAEVKNREARSRRVPLVTEIGVNVMRPSFNINTGL